LFDDVVGYVLYSLHADLTPFLVGVRELALKLRESKGVSFHALPPWMGAEPLKK